MPPEPLPRIGDAFAARMLDVVNDGFVALLTSIGHRTGLWDVLAALPPSTSHQVARAAGLDERYVRAWLATMTAGGIVEYALDERTYALPAEHAAFLTPGAGSTTWRCSVRELQGGSSRRSRTWPPST